MNTQIEVDDELMQAALKASGLKSARQAVEAGLKLLLRPQGYARLLELGGQCKWEDSAETKLDDLLAGITPENLPDAADTDWGKPRGSEVISELSLLELLRGPGVP